MKKPKIAELSAILNPVLEKTGYIEFGLDKPEIGKDVFVGFNCLDGKSDRADYDSRRTLEKLVKKSLEDTNWRLMSEGVSYRLGYLTGRLRAYEREDDLLRLVAKSENLELLYRPHCGNQPLCGYTTSNDRCLTAAIPNGRYELACSVADIAITVHHPGKILALI